MGAEARCSKKEAHVALLLLMAAVACDSYSAPIDPVAMTRVSDDVVVLIRPCRGDEIRKVELIRSEDPLIEPTDERLWGIETDEVVAMNEITLGDAPEGFSESIPLQEDLPTQTVLTVRVALAGGGTYSADFELDEVPTDGDVFYSRDVVSKEEFTQDSREQCNP